ncbi:MAG: hypothetical protein JSU87_05545 [Gemmatimonadota bacterium]|nr:MAG: hypothetical protein JSU87_05545 [Gemmatimonadota bacterium]
MTLVRRLTLALAVLSIAIPATARAQSATYLLEQGIRAYNELELNDAVDLLERALRFSENGGLTRTDRARALTYIGAIQVFRGDADSAATVFRNLVVTDPRYTPDELIFPPEVTSIFQAVRRETKVVALEADSESQFQIGDGWFSVWLFASSDHFITAEIRREDETPTRVLYTGPIAESLQLRWDGRDANGEPAATGDYVLSVVSRDSLRRTLRTVRMPLDIELESPDTLDFPTLPPDSLFRPVHSSSRPGFEALAGGLLAGAAAFLLPSVVAPDDIDVSAGGYVVAGALAVAGITGFLVSGPGEVLDDNVEYNESLRRQIQQRSEEISRQNAELRNQVGLRIRTRGPTVLEPGP